MQEIYLLSRAKIFKKSELETSEYTYDPYTGLNFIEENGVFEKAVLSQKFSPTHSKTMAAPGDDDPDDGRCY